MRNQFITYFDFIHFRLIRLCHFFDAIIEGLSTSNVTYFSIYMNFDTILVSKS
jgi:hypothetical protein